MWLGDMDKEKIQAYINAPIDGNGPVRKILVGFIIILFFSVLPIFIMGIVQEDMATIVIIFIVTLIVGLLPFFLRGGVNENKEKVILLMGIQNIYFSFMCILSTYKVISSAVNVSIWYLVVGILIDVVLCLNFNRIILKKIEMGYYCQQRKEKNSSIPPALAAGLGLLIGKILTPYVSQTAAIIFICFLFIWLSVVGAQRTHNFLKYYFIKTLNLKVESMWDK